MSVLIWLIFLHATKNSGLSGKETFISHLFYMIKYIVTSFISRNMIVNIVT